MRFFQFSSMEQTKKNRDSEHHLLARLNNAVVVD